MRRLDDRAGEVLARSVRRARRCMQQRDTLSCRYSFTLPVGSLPACDLLFDLSQLVHWWPDVLRVRPLPSGAAATGGCALLEGRWCSRLLRIAGFTPGHRLLLVIQGERDSTLLDLAVRSNDASRVRIDLVLETPLHSGRWRALWQRLSLSTRTAASGWALSRLLHARLCPRRGRMTAVRI